MTMTNPNAAGGGSLPVSGPTTSDAEGDGLFIEDDGGCPAEVEISAHAPAGQQGEVDFLSALMGQGEPPQASPAPAPTPAPTPSSPPPDSPPTSPAPPPAAPATPAPAPASKDIFDHEALAKQIAGEIDTLRRDFGIDVLENQRACDSNNAVHVAIYNMRHNPMGLIQMPASTLCVYEAALSAHQVHVQSVENYWTVQHQYIGRQMDMVMRKRRGKYKGDTEKDKELAVLENEPDMRQMRSAFLRAQALATFMAGMGQRFAQLEDGLKRLIDYRRDEENRVHMQNKWQA